MAKKREKRRVGWIRSFVMATLLLAMVLGGAAGYALYTGTAVTVGDTNVTETVTNTVIDAVDTVLDTAKDFLGWDKQAEPQPQAGEVKLPD